MSFSQFTKKLTMITFLLSMFIFAGCDNSMKENQNVHSSKKTDSENRPSSVKVMVIGDEDIYLDEVLFYAMQNLILNHGTKELVNANSKKYKDATLSLIRTTKVLYDVVEHNDIVLTDDEKKQVQTTIDNFKDKVPETLLEDYDISEETIIRAFTEQACVTKFENKIRSEMFEKAFEDMKQKCENYNFVELKYIVFPTVEADENNSPAKDAEGGYIYISENEKVQVRKNVEEFVRRIESGDELEQILIEYGVNDYAEDMSGYVGSFSDRMNEAVEGLAAGQCSEIMEDALGYLVLYVKADHNQELMESYAYMLATDITEQDFSSLETQWLSSVVIDEEKDMFGTVWEDYDLSDLARELEASGLIIK